jgi:hypothetical protein
MTSFGGNPTQIRNHATKVNAAAKGVGEGVSASTEVHLGPESFGELVGD